MEFHNGFPMPLFVPTKSSKKALRTLRVLLVFNQAVVTDIFKRSTRDIKHEAKQPPSKTFLDHNR